MVGLVDSFRQDIDRVFDELRALWFGRDDISAPEEFFDQLDDILQMIRTAYTNSRLRADENMRGIEGAFGSVARERPALGRAIDWARIEPPLLAALKQLSAMQSNADRLMLPLPWRVYDFFMSHPVGVIMTLLATIIIPAFVCSCRIGR